MQGALRCCVLLLGAWLAACAREQRRQSTLHWHVAARPEDLEEVTTPAQHSLLRQLGRNSSGVAGGTADGPNEQQPPSSEELPEGAHSFAVNDPKVSKVKEITRDIHNLPDAVRDMFKSYNRQLDELLPGLERRTSSSIFLPIIVAFGFAWLLVYFNFFYLLDHEEHLNRDDLYVMDSRQPQGSMAPMSPIEEHATSHHTTSHHTSPGADTATSPKGGNELKQDEVFRVPGHADMVFVFHHPSYQSSDRGVDVTRGMLKSVISHRSETGFFVELENKIEEIEKQFEKQREEELEKPLKDRSKERIQRLLSHQGIGTNMHEARTMVLKDMVRSLPLLGFNVALFSSIDDDELFLCVSLTQPEVIRHYLHVESKELQTTHLVVKKLNVSQDPDDPSSSPPFVRYDQRIVAALQKAGTLDEGGDERDLYRTYHDRDAEGTEGSIMSSRERIRVIQREVTRYLNLDNAKDTGFLKDWYPCHSELWLAQLRMTWSSWECMKDMTFVQPIPLLREYFGSQLAFSFAWQGVWCKGLLGLSVVAISIYSVKFGPGFFLGKGYEIIPEKQIMPFSIIVLIWARVMTNLWQREEEYFRCLWNQETIDDQIVRPSFKGVPMKSDVDDNKMEENADRMTAIGKRFISTTVMIICCLFVMVVTGAWVHSHGGQLHTTSSVCLSMMVKTFEILYNTLSAKLIEMENHKFDQDFHDAWVWQQFMFQAVNSYWPCMSIAWSQLIVYKQCPEIGCFESMRKQVSTLVVILIACSILFLGLERIQVWYDMWSEDRGLKQLGFSAKRSVVEEQSKYSVYDMRAQVENMLQLVLGLGFVLLFGTLQPLVAPLCFVHFACSMRCRAVLLTWFTKRSLPHKLQGIGAWSDVMGTLMNFSVVFSGVLVVTWGRFFHGAADLAQISGFAAWIMMVAVAWALVDIICPPKSKEAQIMVKRRLYAHRVLITASMGATVEQNGPFQSGELELGLPPVDKDTTDPDKLRDDDDEEREERRLSQQSALAFGTEGVLLAVTDSVSRRTMQLDIGCTVQMLSPQAELVMEEAWDHIPYLGTKDDSPGTTSRTAGGDSARPSLAEQP